MFILVIMLGVKLKHDLVAIAGEINLLIKLYMSCLLYTSAFLNGGVRIILTDERCDPPVQYSFHYEGGVVEYVRYINKNKEVLHPDPIYFSAVKNDNPVSYTHLDVYKRQPPPLAGEANE